MKNETCAQIKIRYREVAIARAVRVAVSPDNHQAPQGIQLRTETEDCELQIHIKCSKGIGSLIATIDDLLSCVQAAERAISRVHEK
jgi:hypothetical protein